MAAGDLTTTQRVKTWLGITSAADDATIDLLVTNVSDYIKSWLSRDLLSASFSEIRNGTGTGTMVLNNYPITAVTNLTINGTTINQYIEGVQHGYFFDNACLYLSSGRFYSGLGNVRISYNAGFAGVPADIEQAAVELCAYRYRERSRIGEDSRVTADRQQVDFTREPMPRAVMEILKQYRKMSNP